MDRIVRVIVARNSAPVGVPAGKVYGAKRRKSPKDSNCSHKNFRMSHNRMGTRSSLTLARSSAIQRSSLRSLDQSQRQMKSTSVSNPTLKRAPPHTPSLSEDEPARPTFVFCSFVYMSVCSRELETHHAVDLPNRIRGKASTHIYTFDDLCAH